MSNGFVVFLPVNTRTGEVDYEVLDNGVITDEKNCHSVDFGWEWREFEIVPKGWTRDV